MQIVIQAGMHKTGTSSFKSWLNHNQEALMALGVAAFAKDARILAGRDALYDPQSILEDLKRLRDQGTETVVFTHEGVSQLSTDSLKKLYDLFQPYPVRYTVTLRHWDGYLYSRWQQNCVRRDTQSFRSYIRDLTHDPAGRPDICYEQPVLRIKEAGFKDIAVVSYDYEEPGQGLINTVADACLIPSGRLPDFATPIRHVSKDPIVSEQIRLFNGVVSSTQGLAANPMAMRALTGKPIDKPFQIGAWIDTVVTKNPAVADALRTLVEDSLEEFTLDPNAVAEWEERATKVVAPYLVNPRNGALFPKRDLRKRMVSALEVRDLPEKLIGDMSTVLQATHPQLFA